MACSSALATPALAPRQLRPAAEFLTSPSPSTDSPYTCEKGGLALAQREGKCDVPLLVIRPILGGARWSAISLERALRALLELVLSTAHSTVLSCCHQSADSALDSFLSTIPLLLKGASSVARRLLVSLEEEPVCSEMSQRSLKVGRAGGRWEEGERKKEARRT